MEKQRIIYQVRIARLPIVPFIISTSAWLLCWAVPSCISLPAHWTVNKIVLWFILCGGALYVYVQINISVRSNKLRGEKYVNLVVTLYVIRSLVDCFVLGDKKKSLFYLKYGRWNKGRRWNTVDTFLLQWTNHLQKFASCHPVALHLSR